MKKVHTTKYLKSLENSSIIASISEIPFRWAPNSFLQSKILDPMRYGTHGTIKAIDLALEHENGIGINLSGGYHHARTENQRGSFCFFADVPLYLLFEKNTQNLEIY